MWSASLSCERLNGSTNPTVEPAPKAVIATCCVVALWCAQQFLQAGPGHLQRQIIGHAFRTMAGDRVPDLVRQNDRQAAVVTRQGQDAAVDCDLAAGRQKAFWVFGSSMSANSQSKSGASATAAIRLPTRSRR
jgi:hypothetical protein